MDRRARTRILVLSPPELARNWARAIRQGHDVDVLEAPRAGLVMTKVLESARKSEFYLGEVLVTEAKVRVAGSSGMGLVRGWNEELSLDLAIIDAACRAQLPVVQEWEPELRRYEADLEARLEQERRLLETTRVDFQTMDTGPAL